MVVQQWRTLFSHDLITLRIYSGSNQVRVANISISEFSTCSLSPPGCCSTCRVQFEARSFLPVLVTTHLLHQNKQPVDEGDRSLRGGGRRAQ